MMKKQSNTDENISEISTYIDSIDNTITSLSTSIRDIIREARSAANEDMMPTPQLAEMISATIKEQILIEFNLSKEYTKVVEDITGTFKLFRSNELSDFKTWDEILRFTLSGKSFLNWSWKDFTIQ